MQGLEFKPRPLPKQKLTTKSNTLCFHFQSNLSDFQICFQECLLLPSILYAFNLPLFCFFYHRKCRYERLQICVVLVLPLRETNETVQLTESAKPPVFPSFNRFSYLVILVFSWVVFIVIRTEYWSGSRSNRLNRPVWSSFYNLGFNKFKQTIEFK